METTHNIKPGDIFHAQWGWEQTNNDFYMVAELIGKTMCKLVKFVPAVKHSIPVGQMSEHTIFDFEKGGRCVGEAFKKKIITHAKVYGEKIRIPTRIRISSFETAFLMNDDDKRKAIYSSWYA